MSIRLHEPADLAPSAANPPNQLRELWPGLAVCAVATAAVLGIARLLPSVSPLLIAIALGAVLANVVSLPQRIRPGLAFSGKRLLRVGVALLGLQLVFGDILALGPWTVVLVIAIVLIGILVTLQVGKWLGMSPEQRLLIACGFSICGAAAAAAVDGVIEAEEEELLTTVALVVVFGTAAIFAVPMLAGLIGLDDRQAGMFAGGSIHEVAQVVAAGGAIGGSALSVAVVVKLARVAMLAPVIAAIGVHRRRVSAQPTGRRPPLVPLFVVGFLGCAGLRTAGLVSPTVLADAKLVQTGLLVAAMFALGAGVRIATLRKVGPRPFVLATVATAVVGAVALLGAVIAG